MKTNYAIDSCYYELWHDITLVLVRKYKRCGLIKTNLASDAFLAKAATEENSVLLNYALIKNESGIMRKVVHIDIHYTVRFTWKISTIARVHMHPGNLWCAPARMHVRSKKELTYDGGRMSTRFFDLNALLRLVYEFCNLSIHKYHIDSGNL